MTYLLKNFEELTEAQLYEVAELDSKIPVELDPRYHWEESFAQERYDYFKDLTGLKLAALTDGRVIGFHVMYITEKAFAKIANISTFWVHPGHRRQGLGKMLKVAGEKWARKNNCDYIQTNVHKDNLRMIEINQNAGFDVTYLNMRKYLK